MSGRIVQRLFGALITLIIASATVFVILRVLPGDPARLILGPLASPAALHAQRQAMGLNAPIYVQYARYMSGFVQGNWGFDYGNGITVVSEVGNRLPATLELDFYAMLFAVVGAVTLSLWSVTSRTGDLFGRTLAYVGLGSAPFWIGLILLVLFSSVLGVLPGPVGRLNEGVTPPPAVTHFYTFDALLHGSFGLFADAFEHLILPAVTLGLLPFGYLFRLLRQSLDELRDSEFMLVYRSKGLTYRQAMMRHGLANAALPALTAAGLLAAQLVAGSILVEEVFHWPGVGELVVDSVSQSEYAVVEAFVILGAAVFVVTNVIVDLLYGVIDPRLRRPADA